MNREIWLRVLLTVVGGPALIAISRRKEMGWYFDVGLKLLGLAVIMHNGRVLLTDWQEGRLTFNLPAPSPATTRQPPADREPIPAEYRALN